MRLTAEGEAARERIRLAQVDLLKKAMLMPPFDIQTSCATRVRAWKVAMDDAHKLLNRARPDTAHLISCREDIEWCGGGQIAELAAYFFKDEKTGKRAPRPKSR